MIYAKEPPEIAQALLGKPLWNKIYRETDVKGGLGHKLYEELTVAYLSKLGLQAGHRCLQAMANKMSVLTVLSQHAHGWGCSMRGDGPYTTL